MDTADFNVIMILLGFLGLGSAFIHYTTFSRSKAKVLVKKELDKNP